MKAGKDGGMAAVDMDFDAVMNFRRSDAGILPPESRDLSKKASDDVFRTVRALFQSPRRKACPPHSLPAEVWHMLLRPRFGSRPGTVSSLGIGHKDAEASTLLREKTAPLLERWTDGLLHVSSAGAQLERVRRQRGDQG